MTLPEFNAAVEAIARVLVTLAADDRPGAMSAAIDLAVRIDRAAAAQAALAKALAVRDDSAGNE
jgi:hypothetical protein